MEALLNTGHTRYRLQLSKKSGVAQWKLYLPLGTQDIGNSYQRRVESLSEALLTTGHTRYR